MLTSNKFPNAATFPQQVVECEARRLHFSGESPTLDIFSNTGECQARINKALLIKNRGSPQIVIICYWNDWNGTPPIEQPWRGVYESAVEITLLVYMREEVVIPTLRCPRNHIMILEGPTLDYDLPIGGWSYHHKKWEFFSAVPISWWDDHKT